MAQGQIILGRSQLLSDVDSELFDDSETMVDDSEILEVDADENSEVFIDIPEDGMKAGLSFPNEKCALNSIQKWSEKVFCTLIKIRRTKLCGCYKLMLLF